MLERVCFPFLIFRDWLCQLFLVCAAKWLAMLQQKVENEELNNSGKK